MATRRRIFHCEPEDVFRVLGDGWLYPVWVVGASRMRNVDDAWPEPGTKLLHSVGTWPALINDSTTCEVWDAPHRMELTARGWPVGEAHVTIDVRPHPDGCTVAIREEAVRGPATWLPTWVTGGLLQMRNRETLRRLSFIAEGTKGTQRRSID